jgi:hypothetical protein
MLITVFSFVGISKATGKKSMIQIREPVYRNRSGISSKNVTDPEHCSWCKIIHITHTIRGGGD